MTECTTASVVEIDSTSSRDCDGTRSEVRETHRIEIEMSYAGSRKPLAGQAFRVRLPDGTVVRGSLDENGFASADGH